MCKPICIIIRMRISLHAMCTGMICMEVFMGKICSGPRSRKKKLFIHICIYLCQIKKNIRSNKTDQVEGEVSWKVLPGSSFVWLYKGHGQNIHRFLWNAITHSCPNFNGGLHQPLLKIGHDMGDYIPAFYADVITYIYPTLSAGLVPVATFPFLLPQVLSDVHGGAKFGAPQTGLSVCPECEQSAVLWA